MMSILFAGLPQVDASILFVDSDIVWLQDPMPALQAVAADVAVTHDGMQAHCNTLHMLK